MVENWGKTRIKDIQGNRVDGSLWMKEELTNEQL